MVRRKQVPHAETKGLHDLLGRAARKAVKQNAAVVPEAEAKAVSRLVVVALALGRPATTGWLYVIQTPEKA